MSNEPKEPEEIFADIVNRELRHQATPEEVIYLQNHPKEWRIELTTKYNIIENHIASLKQEIDLDIFHDHALEYEVRLKKATRFHRVLRSRLVQVNQYVKAHNVQQINTKRAELSENEQYIERRKKEAFTKGWGTGIDRFNALMENGLSQEQAFLACCAYGKSLHLWIKSTELMIPLPPFEQEG